MPKRQSIIMRSVAVLVAATIGAGIFGVPYVMAKAGIFVGLFWLIVVAFVIMLENLLLGEIALRLPDRFRFAGFARAILKPRMAMFTEFLLMLSLLGAMIAYLLLGTQFLTNLLSPVIQVNWYVMLLIYFLISSLIISRKFSDIQRIDVLSISLLVTLVFLLLAISLPKAHLSFLPFIDTTNFFLPYGVILFSLASAGVIPTLEASMNGYKNELRKVIIISGIISTTITGVFGVVVALVSTYSTTPDAIAGLASYAGNGVLYLGSLIGLVAMFGVHGLSGNNMKEILQNDFGVSERKSILLVILIPLIIVASGFLTFIKVLSLVGGVVSGLVGIMIGVMSLRSHHMKTRNPEYCLRADRFWAWLVILVFAAGAIYEIYYTFIK